ncbi:MAG TPA: hypothetical protein VF152_01175 [Acidimicrobiia bacterium]
MLALWVPVFVAGGAVLVWAGVGVAASGDEIATRTGAGQLLIGAFLAALATSLPEVVSNASAALADEPALAVGTVFGSSMANMAILAGLDLVHRGAMLTSVELRQARLAAVAIMLTSVAVLGIVDPSDVEIGWIGVYPFVITGLYLLTLRWLGPPRVPTLPGPDPLPRPSRLSRLRTAGIGPAARRFAVAAAAIFVAAPVVVSAAERISDETGISSGFVGVAFVAVATSLPEVFTSLAAVRIGAYDLAVGNLLGSNSFNVASLVVADLFYTRGALMSAVGPVDVIAGLVAITLMAIALAAIVVETDEERVGALEPGPLLLLAAYALGIVVVGAAGI